MTWTPEQIEQACRTLVPGFDAWRNAEGFYFDPAAAQRVIDFAHELCTFTNAEWNGHPVVLRPWQVAFLGNLFGWKRCDNHTRRFRRAALFTAKKSGKTEVAGIVATYLLFCDGEPSPEIVSCAGNADQAKRVFQAASRMVKNEPRLLSRAEVLTRSIVHRENGGSYQVINSEGSTKHGGLLHGCLADELLAMRNAELLDALETSTRGRRQPLVLYTSTAGVDPESICAEKWDYAVRVRDGLIDDPTFLPAVFTVPIDADISDPEVWKLAQPNLGVTVSVDEYRRDYQEALAVPRKMQTFRQFSLNQWVSAATAWIDLDRWKACAGEVDLESLKGKKAVLGIDLSSTTDTSSVVAAVADGEKVRVLPFIFIPVANAGETYRRARRDHAPYQTWLDQKAIVGTPGDCIDYGFIEAKVLELAKVLDVVQIQADPYNASGLLERLQKAGLNVVTVRQGWSLAEATKATEVAIRKGELVHPNNPAFNYQISCTAVKHDEHDNVWPVKSRSTGRIDSAVSLVMAMNGLKFGGGAGQDGGDVGFMVF